jgi:hypothetical protein
MHPTKAELEDVWNKGSVGWLRDYSKKSSKKNHVPRKVKVRFYRKEYVHEIEEVVWAKKSESASDHSWGVIQKHFPDYKTRPSDCYEVSWTDPR